MKWMSSHITIGNYVFRNRMNAVEIKSSRKTLTDTAMIKLANIKGLLERGIKVGDTVEISLGYNGELHPEFKGYVSSISPKIPFEVSCEDEMWQQKQRTFHKSYESITLKNLLQEMIPEGNFEVPDITLAPFRINKDVKSVAMVLEQLKKEYGIDIYYRNQTLFAGLAYTENLGTVNYSFQRAPKQESLTFKTASDVKIKVKAINISPDNKKTTYELGDNEGETHTLHFYNKTEAEIKQLVAAKINLMKYDGYRGKFKAKGIPRPVHSMIAKLIDSKYPERESECFIDTVVTRYDGSGGFSRDLELGRSASFKLLE